MEPSPSEPITATAGTDVACVALFDPAALPPDFDQSPDQELPEAILRLPTGADGAYLLHVFVNQDLPVAISALLRPGEVLEAPSFRVPSGQLVFAGSEFAFSRDDSRLARYPAMGTRFEVKPGRYALRVHQCEIPDETIEERVATELGAGGAALLDRVDTYRALTVFSVMGTLFLSPLLPAPALAVTVAAGVLSFIAERRLSGSERYRELVEKRSAIALRYPSMVAELRLLDPA